MYKRTDDEIVISDVRSKKLIFYSADGNFLEEISYPANLQKIGVLSQSLICVHIGRFSNSGSSGETLSQVIVVNRQGELVKKYFPYETNLSFALGEGFSNGHDGGLSYFKLMDPKIYQINQDLTLDISWEFDFGKYQADTSAIFLTGQEGIDKLTHLTKTKPFFDIAEMSQNSQTFTMEVHFRGTGYQMFFDQDTRNLLTMVADTLGILGMCDNIPIYPPKSSHQDYFISTISPTEWPGNTEIKEDDNPVLVLFKVKDF